MRFLTTGRVSGGLRSRGSPGVRLRARGTGTDIPWCPLPSPTPHTLWSSPVDVAHGGAGAGLGAGRGRAAVPSVSLAHAVPVDPPARQAVLVHAGAGHHVLAPGGHHLLLRHRHCLLAPPPATAPGHPPASPGACASLAPLPMRDSPLGSLGCSPEQQRGQDARARATGLPGPCHPCRGSLLPASAGQPLERRIWWWCCWRAHRARGVPKLSPRGWSLLSFTSAQWVKAELGVPPLQGGPGDGDRVPDPVGVPRGCPLLGGAVPGLELGGRCPMPPAPSRAPHLGLPGPAALRPLSPDLSQPQNRPKGQLFIRWVRPARASCGAGDWAQLPAVETPPPVAPGEADAVSRAKRCGLVPLQRLCPARHPAPRPPCPRHGCS